GDTARDAREDGRFALGIGAGFAPPQALDQVEEITWIVRLERDHEFLVVQAKGVARVDLDAWKLVADPNVLVHRPLAFVERQSVPRPLLDHRIDEQVAPTRWPDA